MTQKQNRSSAVSIFHRFKMATVCDAFTIKNLKFYRYINYGIFVTIKSKSIEFGRI